MKQEPDRAVNPNSILRGKEILFALALLALMLMLTSCTSTAPAAPTPTAEITQTPLPTATSAPTLTPTIRVSPSVTPTQVYPAASHVQHACLEEAEKQIPNELPGSLIVYYDAPPVLTPTPGSQERTGSDFRLTLQTGQMRAIPVNLEGTFNSSLHVSPDGSLLAYRSGGTGEGDWLAVESASGEILQKIQWKANWKDASISRWLNNEQIVIEQIALSEKPVSNFPKFIFNPFTQEEQVLPALENVFSICGFCPWKGQILVVYDPNLQYVVYPLINEKETSIVLKEANHSEIISRLPLYSIRTAPKWAPDGQFFVDSAATKVENGEISQDELYQLRIDGGVEQLTHFSLAFPNVSIRVLSISPDSGQVAFWYEGTQTHLAVYDFQTQQVSDLCLTSNGIDSYYGAPVWSPDGRYLALEVFGENSQPRLVIVDLQAGTYVEYMDNVYIYGWMK